MTSQIPMVTIICYFSLFLKRTDQRHFQENTVGAHCRFRVTYKSVMLMFVSRVFSLHVTALAECRHQKVWSVDVTLQC